MVYPRDRYGGYVVKCVQREGRDLPIFFFFARKDVNLLTFVYKAEDIVYHDNGYLRKAQDVSF